VDGRPASFLGAIEPETVATWDTAPIDRAEDVPSGAEGAILEQLEALGYFEGEAP